jgi:hypothetical protein
VCAATYVRDATCWGAEAGYCAVDRPETMLRRLTPLLAITLAAASCGSDGTNATDREADIYVTLIRELAPSEPAERGPSKEIDELDRVIFAGSLDEHQAISLEVQAAVVEQLEQFATVRFVDERAEAIDHTDDREPVLEDGVLVLLGPVPSGRTPSVDAERYVDIDDSVHVRVTLGPEDGDWEVGTVDTLGR